MTDDDLLLPGVHSVAPEGTWRGRLATTGVVREYTVAAEAVTDKATLMREVATALEFPEYFGANWDALLDCLRDMSWARAETHVVVVRDAERMRAVWPPDVTLEFLDVMQVAIDFHSAHSGAMFLVLEL